LAWDIHEDFDMQSGVRKPMSGRTVSLVLRPALLLLLPVLGILTAWSVPVPSKTFSNLVSRKGWPLFFEAGFVQNGRPTNFLARGPNYQVAVTPAGVDFILRKPQIFPERNSIRREEATRIGSGVARLLRMTFASPNARATISGEGEMEGKVNYLLGNEPAQWRTQVSTFAGVKVEALYPGVDLVFYGNHGQLEYDFMIAPKADPAAVSIRFDGADKLAINKEGELIVSLGDAQLRQHRPSIYQFVGGVRHEIIGGYQLEDPCTISFVVGPYDHDRPLVIDPIFSYATYFGGNGGDTGLAIKVDRNGSVYLAGETLSTQLSSSIPGNPFQSQLHGGSVTGDAFIAKLDSTGSKLLYFTYLGGTGDDGAYDLAIDSAGNAYVTGFTVSPDFPTKNALFGHISGSPDANFHLYPVEVFVTELNAQGSDLVYSTYLGGSGNDVGSAIALDPAGYAYVTGYTSSTDFPVRNALQSSSGGVSDVFIAKFAPGGGSLVYSTYFGGIGIDQGEGIAADSDGYAYVAGSTASSNFPITAGASQTNLNGSGASVSVFDAFLTKIAPNGNYLVYSTYLGGAQNEFGYRVAIDNSGSAYLAGTTQSSDFLRTNSFVLGIGENGTNAINFDGFLTKFNPAGLPEYSAQFGGTDNDVAWGVDVDGTGRAFVVGMTLSTNFPVAKPFGLFRSYNSGAKDVFVVAFETNASSVLYSAYLGGGADDFGYAIAVDAESNVYISGMTLSSGFPVTSGPFQSTLDGSSDAFVAKIRLMDPLLSVEHSGGAFQLTWPATAPDYLLQSTTDLSPPQTWVTVPQTPVLTNGQYLVSFVSKNPLTLFRLSRP
jgi:hypothetical protein